jgi:hypothetical protein
MKKPRSGPPTEGRETIGDGAAAGCGARWRPRAGGGRRPRARRLPRARKAVGLCPRSRGMRAGGRRLARIRPDAGKGRREKRRCLRCAAKGVLRPRPCSHGMDAHRRDGRDGGPVRRCGRRRAEHAAAVTELRRGRGRQPRRKRIAKRPPNRRAGGIRSEVAPARRWRQPAPRRAATASAQAGGPCPRNRGMRAGGGRPDADQAGCRRGPPWKAAMPAVCGQGRSAPVPV